MERVLSSPIMNFHPTHALDDRDRTQNFIAEAVNAEKQLWKLIHVKGLLCTEVQDLYCKARTSYEKSILSDLELVELQDIEYSLWKLHYKHIDEYRNRIRDLAKKECTDLTTVRNSTAVQPNSENLLEEFKSFLSEATKFYHDLIVKVKRSYGQAGEVMFVNAGAFSSSMDLKPRRCQFLCHRCLVCLGDLARYRELYGNPDVQKRNWSAAATHYLNASMMWPDSGNPQNQLALLAIYVGDELLALYHCIRSLAVKEPFPDAWDNLILLFEKNASSHLHSLTNAGNFNFSKPSERSTLQIKTQSSNNSSNCQKREAAGDVFPERTSLWSLIVRMISFFYVKSSLKDFPSIFGSTIRELEALLSLDDARLRAALESYQHMGAARTGPFRALQLTSVLIFTVYMLMESSKLQLPTHIKEIQQPSLTLLALASTFTCMGRLVNRCLMANPVDSSPLLPAVLVFVEWLVDMLGTAGKYMTDEKCAIAITYFFDVFVDLLDRLNGKGDGSESVDFPALWEDIELCGFSPILKFNEALDTLIGQEPRNGFDNKNECEVRIRRILAAAMKIVNRSPASQKWMFYDKMRRKFYTIESKKRMDRAESKAAEDSKFLVCDDDHNKLGMQGTSSPIEDEEVILFKPITRYNSAPLYIPETTERILDQAAPSSDCFRRVSSLKLPRKETSIDPSSLCSDSNISSGSITFWDPIPEDSAMDSFPEHSIDSPRFGVGDTLTDGLPSPAGPPSLSAWVLDKEKGSIDSVNCGSRGTDDIASAYITGLSIAETSASKQDVEATSSAPTSHFMYGLPSWEDPSSTNDCMVPPHLPPLPSAPLLPDDATWFNGDSSNDADYMQLESMKHDFPGASRVNSYLNSTGAKVASTFDPNNPILSSGYRPFSDIIRSSQWLHHYQDNLGLDQDHDHVLPHQAYTPTTLGRIHDHDLSNQMKYLPNPPFRPGYHDVSSADEHKNERFFNGYPRPSPHAYGAASNLRSEQLLLQYLKEKEWHLQREAQLRGPPQNNLLQ